MCLCRIEPLVSKLGDGTSTSIPTSVAGRDFAPTPLFKSHTPLLFKSWRCLSVRPSGAAATLAIFKVTHKVTHYHIWYSVGIFATPCCVSDTGIHYYITWALIKYGGNSGPRLATGSLPDYIGKFFVPLKSPLRAELQIILQRSASSVVRRQL